MSNESIKAEQDLIQAGVESELSTEQAGLVDELTQANFRIEELEQLLADALAKVEEQKDSVIRAAAEVDNIRRRAAMDVDKANKFALEKFVNELLPVLDNMERALQGTNPQDEATKAIYEGVELTQKGFLTAVAKFGVKPIDPQGLPFNPEQHQAIGMQPSAEFAANTVMLVMQKGYELNSRLLRPAMVMVSQGGPSQDSASIDIEA
ncbi:MAG: nucleotide exchange factor GrpE [Shewanella sp.]|uniref:nucleotide exchange factor GrpE n=1 Tax=Shewanella sp. TaxID=50422 RepID=UPI003F365FBF